MTSAFSWQNSVSLTATILIICLSLLLDYKFHEDRHFALGFVASVKGC